MLLDGSKVLVVGAGRSGVAAAKLATARGAQVTLTDARSLAELGDAVKGGGLPPGSLWGGAGVRLEFGGHRAATFTSADLIVLSPGVPPTLPELVAARQHGVPITGEVELASRFIRAPIVAVTGTNGKSTVTSLCGEIARATGRPTFVGGNLGTPLSDAVGTDAASQHGIVVCELSSFQLETCETFHPKAAILLNITPDHLDRYPTMTAYADAKMRIIRQLRQGDVFVMSEDDPGCLDAYHRHVGGWLPILTYSTRGRPQHRYTQSTGDGVVTIDAGGHVDGSSLVLRLPGAAGPPPKDGAGCDGAMEEERYPESDLQIVGRHNLGNALAAYLAMRGAGLASPDHLRAGARGFRPLPHRMELIGERGGVRFYDDSKGTNVAAVVASIDGFPRPFVLIAGGRDKGGSYGPLREALGRNHSRGVVVIGEAAEKIASAIEGVAPVHRAATMEAAVRLAASLAHDGDAVVLSPACSSYDMFKDYAHRGRAFREAFGQLDERTA
ncbi:MAG: UDP-N-acetylmuramoyl-L-alanine--D-glutamate ligase [Myxococcales bacterium]|nr:UDP-N-acetylmuramoyl-L-alanine--D-glutamate ligase [Myxococcales bacterium]